MKRTTLAIALAAILAIPFSIPLFADETPATDTQLQANPMGGYLGVSIEHLPHAMRAQLSDVIPRDQGLLVIDVMQGSPADKTGLQPFDILLTYNDQKLYSPEQLTRLVRSDTATQPVTLQIVRGGKISSLDASITQQPISSRSFPPRAWQSPMLQRGHHPHHPKMPHESPSENWESFDSLTLDKQEDGSYKAVIEYLDKGGEKKKLEFAGTRGQIRQQILQQKDMPDIERKQLLDSLTSRDDLLMPAFPFNQGFYLPRWFNWNPDF